MKAIRTNLYARNRQQLHEVVPISTPFAVNIEPTSCCNFKCQYCIHSLGREEMDKLGHGAGYMNMDTYELLLDQLAEFPEKIKSVTFGGMGEPLLHPALPQMVSMLKERNITDRIHIITNGSMLNETLSLQLIEAGTSSMKISLQGIRAEEYLDIAGYKADFEKLKANIEFLYQNKGDCQIGLKVPDISLKRLGISEEEAKCRFYSMFGDSCDLIGIEHIVPCFSKVDYGQVEGMSDKLSRYSIEEKRVKVCSLLFYKVNIKQDGKVTLCTMMGLSDQGMNIHENSLVDIWNGEARNRKILKNLRGIMDMEMELCKTCNLKNDFAYEEDYLDPYVEEIIRRMEQKKYYQ